MHFYSRIGICFFTTFLLICCKVFDVCAVDSHIIENPLVNAIINKDIAKVKNLISEGVDVNERDNCGKTAIMHAYSHFSGVPNSKDNFLRDVIEILLKAGSSDIVKIDDTMVVQAGLLDVNSLDKHIHPVIFKHCFLGMVDRCSKDVLKEVNDVIAKGCF